MNRISTGLLAMAFSVTAVSFAEADAKKQEFRGKVTGITSSSVMVMDSKSQVMEFDRRSLEKRLPKDISQNLKVGDEIQLWYTTEIKRATQVPSNEAGTVPDSGTNVDAAGRSSELGGQAVPGDIQEDNRSALSASRDQLSEERADRPNDPARGAKQPRYVPGGDVPSGDTVTEYSHESESQS